VIEWLTLDELSRHLKVSRAFLYKEAQAGRIPASKVGRSWRFDRARVDQWLKEKEGKGDERLAPEFPWSDCLEVFLADLRKAFGRRFSSLWVYGSWARGDAHPESDVDLLIVLKDVRDYWKDYETIRPLAYQATFGRDRLVVFSTMLVDEKNFGTSMEPLLLNVRREGRKAA
jgi:excisionase family DNA binding protein